MKIYGTGPLRAGRVEIGRVVKPQGVKGELKVAPLMAVAPFKGVQRLFLAAGSAAGPAVVPAVGFGDQPGGSGDKSRSYQVLAARGSAEAVIVRLAGVDDRDRAEALRGFTVEVALDQLPILPAGEFYWHQLAGLPVRDDQGRELGTVSDLLPTAARSVLVISDSSGREILVPVHQEFMSLRVDHLLLTPPPGLLEING